MIRFTDVSVRFGERDLIKKLNLQISEGEKVLLFGQSGMGKTTIFRMILGFMNDYSGEIFFKNERISEKNVWKIRRQISYIPQNLILKDETVMDSFENIFGFHTYKNNVDIIKKSRELLKYLSLSEDIFYKKWSSLSGGEKQRIFIIISDLQKRDIYLLDEVTTGMDNLLKRKVMNYFLKKKGKTMLIISHDSEWSEFGEIKTFNLKEKKWI